jgi:hypothetical protein
MTNVYPIVPPSPKVLWWYALLILVLVMPAGYLAVSAWKARRMRVEFSDLGVNVVGEYTRFVARDSLLARDARIVDIAHEDDFELRRRTNGVGFPGYQVGWFETRGHGRVFAMVTNPHQVVYVPTRDGPALLLSVADPDRFIQQLRELSREPRS